MTSLEPQKEILSAIAALRATTKVNALSYYRLQILNCMTRIEDLTGVMFHEYMPTMAKEFVVASDNNDARGLRKIKMLLDAKIDSLYEEGT